jgi:fucose permease
MLDLEKSLEAEGAVAESMPTERVAPSTPLQNRTHDNISISSSEKAAEANNGEALEKKASQTPSQSEKLGKARIAVIMLSLCIALFLAALDMTIVTTALPAIIGSFGATTSDYTWVGSAYLLANAASVPLWGKLSDIWGRKAVILLANVVFLVGSLLCAVSLSIGMLIGGRVVQGVGGGGLIILVNIVISDLFSMRERAKYFGLVGMTWAFASAVGPVIGGVFTEKVSWRWCVSSDEQPLLQTLADTKQVLYQPSTRRLCICHACRFLETPTYTIPLPHRHQVHRLGRSSHHRWWRCHVPSWS